VARFPGAAPAHDTVIARFEGAALGSAPSRAFAGAWPLTILIVDDIEPAREYLLEAARALGYEPCAEASADAGLRRAESLNPDLVLIDLQMPGIDGWAAARRLRAQLGAGSFLVALSANFLADDDVRLAAAGFNGFARKPLRMGELQALLARASEHVRGAPPASPVLDPERVAELREIPSRAGGSLLDSLQARVALELPPLLARAYAASDAASDQVMGELPKTLHDVHGLLALIGATRARLATERCEQELVDGGIRADSWRRFRETNRELLECLAEAQGQ
jgi:CheY-like chemotaxis protein